MVKKIKLKTHDGSNNYLEMIDERRNNFKLVTPISTIRSGETNEGKKFVDPSGGPMIIEGEKLNCYQNSFIVKSISWEKGMGTIITLE